MRHADAPATDLGWMALHAHALFAHDARGRLVAWNRPGAAPPPRLFLGRTRSGVLWRLAADLPGSLVRELARLAAAEHAAPDPARDPERWVVMRRRLEEHAPVEDVWRGPALRFPERLPAPDGARLLDAAERAAAAERFPEIPRLAERLPVAGAFHGGELTSVCHASTGPGRAVEAGLATLPEFRGRRLAERATAAWARAVRAEGRVPLYSTNASNRASLRVAERLGLIAYGWDLHLR